MSIGKNIRRARKKAGVSQKQLAERLQVYQKDISRWENGERTPTLEVFTRICKELNASADTILELKKGENNMNNTIILKFGEAELTKKEYESFSKGDTIFGIDSEPEELKRWNIEQEEEAKAELAKYRCWYRENSESWSVEEYALEYCECNESGELINGSDYEMAAVNP